MRNISRRLNARRAGKLHAHGTSSRTLGTRGPSDYSSPGDRVPLFGSASADFSFFLGPNETFPKVTIRAH
jgi:hypothetical protein